MHTVADSVLTMGNLAKQQLTPQSSDISIKPELVDKLEALWCDFLAAQNIRSNPYATLGGISFIFITWFKLRRWKDLYWPNRRLTTCLSQPPNNVTQIRSSLSNRGIENMVDLIIYYLGHKTTNCKFTEGGESFKNKSRVAWIYLKKLKSKPGRSTPRGVECLLCELPSLKPRQYTHQSSGRPEGAAWRINRSIGWNLRKGLLFVFNNSSFSRSLCSKHLQSFLFSSKVSINLSSGLKLYFSTYDGEFEPLITPIRKLKTGRFGWNWPV